MSTTRFVSFLLPILVLSAACGLMRPPVKPDPSFTGCYSVETDLPASYGDSLGYKIPVIIRLGYTPHGQWIVLPTDPEWHPSWTTYDRLPSGRMRRVLDEAVAAPDATPQSVRDRLVQECRIVLEEDVATCRAIGQLQHV